MPAVRPYWIGDVINAGQLGRHDHRVLISWQIACPVCGVCYTGCTDPVAPRCPHDVSTRTEVPAKDALTEVHDLLAGG